jgi:hypothetical protein
MRQELNATGIKIIQKGFYEGKDYCDSIKMLDGFLVLLFPVESAILCADFDVLCGHSSIG